MRQLGVHILYEYSVAYRPHASSYIRLLRPLSHPALGPGVSSVQSLSYDQEDADVVIVDRLWRPDITPNLVDELIKSVHRGGAKLICALDDNLMDMPSRVVQLETGNVVWPADHHRESLSLLLGGADGVWVTTPSLGDRVASESRSVSVVPNMLDERLLVRAPQPRLADATPKRRLTIGYMGTPTHDADLMMVVPALKAAYDLFGDRLSVEIVGGIQRPETRESLKDLPVHYVGPAPAEHEYPYFMMWFTRTRHWDVAIAPLQNSAFNACKSDIKYLDYAAIGAAPICSRVPAYEGTVCHGETGWLAENETSSWVEALGCLLSDSDLRLRLSTGATDYLYSRRILGVGIGCWAKALADASAF